MITTIEKFELIGIAVKTQNLPQKAEVDIPQLWDKFIKENIVSKIPNRVNNDVYSVYTLYEGDYTQPYTTFLGCKVSSLSTVPEGMITLSIETATYEQFVTKGKMSDNVVLDQWINIWQSDLNRAYIADFEIYKETELDYDNMEVPIFVGINL
ncbi:MAG: hypothetical protein RL662_878 [Bacteroidota bacterium]|jgi:predicted transcriptional regulator YdeE